MSLPQLAASQAPRDLAEAGAAVGTAIAAPAIANAMHVVLFHMIATEILPGPSSAWLTWKVGECSLRGDRFQKRQDAPVQRRLAAGWKPGLAAPVPASLYADA